jgi:hypothetical protein
VFHFGYRPPSITGSGYSRNISAAVSWRPYSLVFRVWLIRSLTPPKTELPATIANRRPKFEKYRGTFFQTRGKYVVGKLLKTLTVVKGGCQGNNGGPRWVFEHGGSEFVRPQGLSIFQQLDEGFHLI